MISLRRHGGEARLDGRLAAGVSAYVDAEWVKGPDGAELPAVMFDSRTTSDCDLAAFAAFSEFAQRAVDTVSGCAPESVEVTGTGLIALEARRILGQPGRSVDMASPAAVIDTSGDPAVILDATRRLTSGGLLVLAGEPLGRRADLNLYPDVHVRALEILGIGSARADATREHEAVAEAAAERAPIVVELGESLPQAYWYAVQT